MALLPVDKAKTKLVSLEEAKERIAELKRANPDLKVGFTCGAYSLPHKGHFESFADSKQHCDVLVVGACSAESLKKLGRMHPNVRDDAWRLTTLARSEAVDFVICNDEPTAVGILQALKPDVFCKGKEEQYKNMDHPEQRAVLEYGGQVILTPIPRKYSSSALLKKQGPESSRNTNTFRNHDTEGKTP
jgi:D-beta-D-heptose 7-phosphate kinase / D-beta-D-heptose 1-phosphate adenosyltransferase